MEIKGAGVLVAGGASGLGAATVRHLVQLGATVTVADVDIAAGKALTEELGAHFVECDVRIEQSIQTAVNEAVQAGGDRGLRVAVSCAGRGFPHRIASTRGPHPLDGFRDVLELNLIGTFNVMRLAATAMLNNQPDTDGERGVLINTASTAAFEGQIGQSAYSASKGGVVSMTLTAARDLARDGIRVLTIAPGVFNTPLLARIDDAARAKLASSVPFPSRLGRPEEFARVVQAILETPMLNGETLRLDGALRMPPR